MKDEIVKLRNGIGRELRKLRAINNYTQEEVSMLSGVDKGTIVRYEQGTVTASLDKLCDILKIYHIELHIFFTYIYENMYRND